MSNYRHPDSSARGSRVRMARPLRHFRDLAGQAGQSRACDRIDSFNQQLARGGTPQNAKSLRPRQSQRRPKKDPRPRGRFWAQAPQISNPALGIPIGGNLDLRHGQSDIAPMLRQSLISLAMLETFIDFGVEQRSHAARERRLPENLKRDL